MDVVEINCYASILLYEFRFSPVNSVWHDYTILLQFLDISQSSLIVVILQMTRTHARAGTSQGGNDGDLPPPPPPSVNEFFVQFLGNQREMEETMCHIAQNTARARQQNQGPKPNQYSTFKDFLETKPPIFKVAEEPL